MGCDAEKIKRCCDLSANIVVSGADASERGCGMILSLVIARERSDRGNPVNYSLL